MRQIERLYAAGVQASLPNVFHAAARRGAP
jgi:hypothetical protein